MREIKEVRETVVGYEAFDGTRFDSLDECKKYESTAEAVIEKAFFELITRETGKTFDDSIIAECDIYEHFGYGSEEYYYAIVEIKDESELEIANRFYEIKKGTGIPREYIGKKILINLGMQYDNYYGVSANPVTREELLKRFEEDIDVYFNGNKGEVADAV